MPFTNWTLPHATWLEFLSSISSDTRRLADRCALAVPVADAVDASLDAHAEALSAVTGSLCHGDLKPLYGVLWMLVDAVVDRRLGSDVDGLTEAAMRLSLVPRR